MYNLVAFTPFTSLGNRGHYFQSIFFVSLPPPKETGVWVVNSDNFVEIEACNKAFLSVAVPSWLISKVPASMWTSFPHKICNIPLNRVPHFVCLFSLMGFWVSSGFAYYE